MPKTNYRNPPLSEPNGWEKSNQNVPVGCTATEKALWLMVFGKGNLAETARDLMNKEAHRRANIPQSELPL